MLLYLTIARYIILACISYLFNCALEQKLVFLNGVITKTIEDKLLSYSPYIFTALIVVYIGIEIWSYVLRKRTYKINLLKDFCKLIFDRHIKPYKGMADKDYRVSFMELTSSVTLADWKNFKFTTTYFKTIARYQTKNPVQISSVKFLPGEGCVGISYAVNNCTMLEVPEYDSSNPQVYYEQCQSTLMLPPDKAKKLKEKAAGYLCLPVRSSNATSVIGVISIDCTTITGIKGFTKNKIRDIENMIELFTLIK